MQQGGQQEFLVPGPLVACQLEHLQAVVEGIAFGMIVGVLLHVRQWLQQQSEKFIGIDVVFHPFHLGIELQAGIFIAQEMFQFGERRALDGAAGDGAFEGVVGFVFGIERQLNGVVVFNVDMREEAFGVVLDDPLFLDGVAVVLVVEDRGDGGLSCC